MSFRRPQFELVFRRLQEKRRHIQVLAGPRQVGKSTLAEQLSRALDMPCRLVSADEATLRSPGWLENQWDSARMLASGSEAVLFLDEVQKLPWWSARVKALWDEDTRKRLPLKVVLLGSSPLLVQDGLSESLAGRFEIIPVTHWSYTEMAEAFGFDLDRYLFFGGYPGAADYVSDFPRWKRYILDSLVETALSRDILLMTRVEKPALLRMLFHHACDYSGQILSYNKMLGQLQDAGNTVTLAHYLELLKGAGMVAGILKFAGQQVRQRGSSPKLQVYNTALMTAQTAEGFAEARRDPAYWGRLVESAVGAHLLNGAREHRLEVFYWRERNFEVDFVLQRGKRLVAVEVKSTRKDRSFSGMDAFAKAFQPQRRLVVGGQGMPLEEFFRMPLDRLMQ